MYNWYKTIRAKAISDGKLDWGVLDSQLLCCQFDENRRPEGEEYTPKEGKNWPPQPEKPRLEDDRKSELLP